MKYLLLVPAVIFSLIFTVWPLAEVVRLSLTKTNFITSEFVGLQNYVAAFRSAPFLRSIANSGLYLVLMVVVTMSLSLMVALTAFPLKKRWHDATRFVFYIPMLSAGVIISQVWRWIWHIDGPINWLIESVGLQPVSWFSRWYTGIPAVVAVVATSGFGSAIIILLAAMLSIDDELFDAAIIDGAKSRQIKWRIIVPIIAPTIGMMALLAGIAAPQVFETIYALAPYEYTATMAFYIYREAFQMSRYGMASAEALVLLVVLMGITYAKQKLERRQ